MARDISIDTISGTAPDVAAAADIVVVERMGQPTRFEIQISAAIEGGDFPVLLDQRFDPGQAISIFAEDLKGGVDCLVSGEADGQVIHIVNGGEGSYVSITGGDVTIAMDREVKVTQWSSPVMTDGAVVMAICGTYAIGCMPANTVATRSSFNHPLVQRRTDLAFLHQLARRNGCEFWVRGNATRVGPVLNTGYFQPISFSNGNLATLRCNAKPNLLDSTPNTIDSINIEFTATAPTEVKAGGIDITSVSDFTADTDLSSVEALGDTSIKDIGASPRTHRLTANADSAADLMPKADAILADSQFFLSAHTTTTVQRLKRIIHVHDTVRVMGAGSRHSGRYYVSGVTHRINAEAHTMDLHLIRNAWGEQPASLLGGLV